MMSYAKITNWLASNKLLFYVGKTKYNFLCFFTQTNKCFILKIAY